MHISEFLRQTIVLISFTIEVIAIRKTTYKKTSDPTVNLRNCLTIQARSSIEASIQCQRSVNCVGVEKFNDGSFGLCDLKTYDDPSENPKHIWLSDTNTETEEELELTSSSPPSSPPQLGM